MANRRFFQFRYSYESSIVDVFGKVSFGSTGAPTLVSASPSVNQGISSISRTSAGLYVISLTDQFARLMMATAMFNNAAAPASPGMFVVTDNSAGATPSITVQFTNSAGTATDPGNGEVVLLKFQLKNSSVM